MKKHKKYGKAKFNSIRISARYFGRYRLYDGKAPDFSALIKLASVFGDCEFDESVILDIKDFNF